jgi:hypothetical protein
MLPSTSESFLVIAPIQDNYSTIKNLRSTGSDSTMNRMDNDDDKRKSSRRFCDKTRSCMRCFDVQKDFYLKILKSLNVYLDGEYGNVEM